MKKRYLFFIIIGALILIPLIVAGVRYFIPVPDNVAYESEEYQTDHAEFLYDLTHNTSTSLIPQFIVSTHKCANSDSLICIAI